MLRYSTLKTQTEVDPNRNRYFVPAFRATAIAAFFALSFLFSSHAIGQDTDVADPPKATTEPDDQADKSAESTKEAEKSSDETAEMEKSADDKDETKTPAVPVKLKELTVDYRGKELSFKAPESWKVKKATNNFTKHDLVVPKAKGEEKDARLTFSIASGSMENNIARWKTQFKFPVGEAPEKVFAMEKKKVDGYELTFVQLRGTYMETMGGPFAGGKKTPRENYMMKAVVISPPGADAKTPKCFIKLVGSEKTIKQHTKAYTAMIKSMKAQAVVD